MLKTALKLLIASCLVGALISSGRLDPATLLLLVDDPGVAAGAVAVWLGAAVFLSTLRWQTLLRALGEPMPFLRAARVHLIGLFFNTVMPGAVGGDVLKAYYVSKEHPRGQRIVAVSSVFIDRIVGLFALLSLGGMGSFFVLEHLDTVPVAVVALARTTLWTWVFASILLAAVLALAATPRVWEMAARRLPRLAIPMAPLQLPLARLVRSPWGLVQALALSFTAQAALISLFIRVGAALEPTLAGNLQLAAILPVGVISTAIPLAPGGLGVSHVAFEALYQMIGSSKGANVFNVVALSQLLLNLIGGLPYLLWREHPMTSDA